MPDQSRSAAAYSAARRCRLSVQGADRVELLAPDVLAPEAERVGQVQQDTWLHDFIGGKKAVQRQRNTAVLRFCMGKCGFRRLLKRIVERSQ